MTSLELTKLMAPLASVVAKPLSDKIQSKLNPSELEKALNVAIKSSSQLGEDLFSRCEPDSVPGFLNKFFKDVVIDEFQKPFNDLGTPQIDYLVAAFRRLAREDSKIKNFHESLITSWMENFVNSFLSETNIYLKIRLAKDKYLDKLATRLSKHHFVGMKITPNEDNTSERLENIFVMPDVAEEVSKSKLSEKQELDSYLSSDISREQAKLFKAQQERALLLEELSEKRNLFPAQNLLDKSKSKGKKIVLLGAPGSGKTTLMNYLALKIAQRKLEDLGFSQYDINSNSIPIFIRIRELAQQDKLDILEYVEEFAAKNLQITDLPNGCFKHWLEQGEVLILLDGLDEVAQENQQVKIVQHIESFLQEFSRNQVIITSRPAGYERGYFRVDGFPHYEIQAFDDRKIKFFIRQWYESHCSDKVEASPQIKNLETAIEKQDRIKLLAKNPLLLTIIVLINRVGAEFPKERYKLYESAVETLLTAWDAGKELNYSLPLEYLKPRDFQPLMRQIAYWIHSKGSTKDREGGTLINKDDLIQQLSQCIIRRYKRKNIELYEAKEEAKSFLEYIQERSGLLDIQGRNCYAFVHKTFQEYLAAEDIDYRHQNDDSFQVVLDNIRNHLHDPHWREVLLLLVAKQKSNKAATAISLILDRNSDYEKWLHRDLFFAADCLAEDPMELQLSDDDPSQEILEKLVELEISDSPEVIYQIHQRVFQIICSLNETEFAGDVLRLLKKHEERIDKVRFQQYSAALGEEQEAIEQLLAFLKDTDYFVSFRATDALVNLGNASDQVVEQLLPLLKDTNDFARRSAADALGKLGNASDQVVEQLLPLLKDTNDFARRSAADALGKLGNASDQVVEQLLPLLKDTNDFARRSAADALGKLGNASDQVVEQLLPLLKDTESDVRRSAAYLLSKLGNASDKVVEKLLILLKDTESDVRRSAADALSKLGNASDQVVEKLLILLKDTESDVRRSAADALGELGNTSDNVVEQLLPLLKDTESDVCASAAYALGELGNTSDNVVEQLLPLLKDTNGVVFEKAISALGKLGNASDKVVEQLLLLLKDTESNVRRGAAIALSNSGNASDKVIEQLLPLLKDPELDMRRSAVYALGKLGNASDKVIEQLLPLLKDKNENIRESAISALDVLENASDKVIEQLLLLLKDFDYFVHESAISALCKLGNTSDKVIEQLLLLLKDNEWYIRRSAMSALGNSGNASDDLIKQLLPLLKDPSRKVRISAKFALYQLGDASENVIVALEKWLEEEQDSKFKTYGISALWDLVVGASYN
ncbi:putative NTPase (NACHT family) [Rivularia sp. PCC 7116]|uniref:HEAT repeat domain-containing protein n=1 Tax=Rivularia sp. PCC 7116 TaxID=373994 RepID=UPI00029F377C|nr:HEAT repeat domain-containing protein [Rivularia sp. PCC 7116]AFY56430.1 putative NTPase (NACHT family) [Rivularia sp. PCC 7116]